MAEGKIPEPLNVKTINIGDNHINVYKYGNIVSLIFSMVIESTAKGWKDFATLPSNVRPIMSFYFMVADSSTDSDGLQAQVISSTGILRVYLPGTRTYPISGIVTYII